METTKISYQAQAEQFATTNKITLKIIGKPKYKKYFNDDKESRHVFKLQLKSNNRTYTFTFGQSVNAGSKKPTMYDVLTCLIKYDPGTFEDFCENFGYNNDSRAAERTYKAVCKEFEAMERLFTTEVLKAMQEIQ